jgi:hypothetical protein
MPNKVICVCFFLIMLIFSACSNVKNPTQTQGEVTNPAKNPKQTETSKPNVVGVQDFTLDCSKVLIPSNVERDTSLNEEKGLLTVRWLDESKGEDVGVVFRYKDQNCSESAKQLVQHVLNTANQTPASTPAKK